MSRAAAIRTDGRTAPSHHGRGGHRFYDSSECAWIVKVLPGQFCVVDQENEILATILGSCVSACIRDPAIGVGGMNHFMLGESKPDSTGSWGADPKSARYGNFAMEKLINELIKQGCVRERLEIKVFGGANVTTTRNHIGSQNGQFVLDYLAAEDLKCTAQDLGGTAPRRIIYYPSTGRVVRRLLAGKDQESTIRLETEYATSVRTTKPNTDIQLFK